MKDCYLTVNNKGNKTVLEINGDYKVVGYFPDSGTSNMVIILEDNNKDNK